MQASLLCHSAMSFSKQPAAACYGLFFIFFCGSNVWYCTVVFVYIYLYIYLYPNVNVPSLPASPLLGYGLGYGFITRTPAAWVQVLPG